MVVREIEQSGQVPAAQDLVLGVFGLYVLGRGQGERGAPRPIPTQVFLSVLGTLGVSEAALRGALNRLVNRGLLARHKDGRTTAYQATDDAKALLRRGRDRMFSPAPFDHAESTWTVLSCPVPEKLRNLRYQLQARLSWAGFGAVQANVWVAPGRVDVEDLLSDPSTRAALGLLEAFYGTPAAPSRPEKLVREAWDVDDLCARHIEFLARWEGAEQTAADALPRLLLLLDDWGRLLRADPGLPVAYLDDDWPARRSAEAFRRLQARLGPPGERRLAALLESEPELVG